MPQFTWQAQSDWSDWTLEDVVAPPTGGLELAEGAASGTATSPVVQAPDWQHWSTMTAQGVRQTGTCMYFYFRSGATSSECQAADWQGPVDVWSVDGYCVVDLRTYYLTHPDLPVGAYFQAKIVLEAE